MTLETRRNRNREIFTGRWHGGYYDRGTGKPNLDEEVELVRFEPYNLSSDEVCIHLGLGSNYTERTPFKDLEARVKEKLISTPRLCRDGKGKIIKCEGNDDNRI